ncbi:unnamed protein product [Allacma fusca]|uniref:Cytochrome P450 n=1 Tax=Allacma fusca TaxID=39272 RepID=A0A8J2PXF9_9HEXA|nr:unnamed protein product [Allacma fusca]
MRGTYKGFLFITISCTAFITICNYYYVEIIPTTAKRHIKTSLKTLLNLLPDPKSFLDESPDYVTNEIENWDEPLHPEIQGFLKDDDLERSKNCTNCSIIKDKHTIKTAGCKIPYIEIFKPGFKRSVNKNPLCSNVQIVALLNENDQILQLQGNFTKENCSVTEVLRSNTSDEAFVFSKPMEIVDTLDVRTKEVFFTRCGNHINIEANFPMKPQVERKIQYWKDKTDLPFNVLFFGFDTTSRAKFHRSLPQAMHLMRQMGFLDFKGYHSVAPYTLENFMGFLLGLDNPGVRSTCAPKWSSSWDACPHIWNYYSKSNFVTMYVEDGSQTFNWGGQGGFRKQPTDYYIHYLFRSTLAIRRNYPLPGVTADCFQQNLNIPRFVLEYQERFAKKFEKTPFFTFAWNNDATHDSSDKLAGLDESITKLLGTLRSSRDILERTMIILVSDHGIRYGDVTQADKFGFLERSLPGLFIRLPEALHRKYPQFNFRDVLKFNSRRLTTGFDIYHTLKHLLVLGGGNLTDNETIAEFQPVLKDRSSLLVPISGDRTCADVNVQIGSCVCNTDDESQAWENPFLRHKLIRFAFNELNGLIESSKYRQMCERYRPIMLTYETSNVLRNFTNRTEGFIRFSTKPYATFEVQLRVLHENSTLDKIERISKFIRNTAYGRGSWCVGFETDEDQTLISSRNNYRPSVSYSDLKQKSSSLASAVFFATTIAFAWWWLTEANNDYWPKRGVPRALLKEFATYMELLTAKKKLQDVDLYYYNKYKSEPFVGIMELRTPSILIRDLELLKKIYVKDFDHFANRRKFHFDNEYNDYFLFGLDDQPWKDLRSVMGPTFTSGKLKRMFDYFQRSGSDLVQYVADQKRKTGLDSVELRDMYGRFVMDLIASTTFGFEGQCLKQEDSAFMKHGQDMIKNDFWRIFRGMVFSLSPGLMSFLRIPFFPAGPTSFFKGVIKRVLKERHEKHGNYKDFVQLMLESANKTTSDESEGASTTRYKITDANILANGLVFIIAGFEGTETLLTLSTYYCAIYPEIQNRLREEIESVLEENKGESSYDAIMKMEYLNMVLSEVLRLHPPFTRTERRVTKEYQIPDTKVVLPVDTIVAISILSVHHDEKHFPEPQKFDPERFSAENKANRHPYAFMPFGHGPRNCIGQ